MLESIINFNEINRRPYLAFAWAFVIVIVSVFIAVKIGFTMPVGGQIVNLSGIFALAFALISSSYFMTALIRKEEMMEEEFIHKHYSRGFWERHEKDVLIFLYFFGGAMVAFALTSMLLPADTFQVQLSSICGLRPELPVCGALSDAATNAEAAFSTILLNNTNVWIFSFVIAFIFGAGSAFILLWNAGILGIYIGMVSRHVFDIPWQSMRFLPHGIPEIAGYICAGLAGTLISTAIIRKADRNVVARVAFDAGIVLAIGWVLVLFGAVVEAFL